jgi:hypothetical protein
MTPDAPFPALESANQRAARSWFRTFVGGSIPLAAAAYLLAVWLADPWLLYFIVIPALVFLAAVALCCVPALVWGLVSHRSLRPPLTLLGIAIAAAALAGAAIPANRFFQAQAEAAAKAYPDRVAPLLESYRQAHGTYPARLEQLPSAPRPPRLLRGSYHSDGNVYSFYYNVPGGLIDVWTYESETHRWHLST